MDNKYVIEVLKKELESLKKEKWGNELMMEDENSKLSKEWLIKDLKEINDKINEIEFHIDFV